MGWCKKGHSGRAVGKKRRGLRAQKVSGDVCMCKQQLQVIGERKRCEGGAGKEVMLDVACCVFGGHGSHYIMCGNLPVMRGLER